MNVQWLSKNIKELEDSLLKNYWNKKKKIYDYTIEKYKRKMVTFKRIIHDYKSITIEKNQKIKSLQIIENIYVCVWLHNRGI